MGMGRDRPGPDCSQDRTDTLRYHGQMPTLSPTMRVEESPRLVGRAEELAAVEALLHATSAGMGGGLLIVGEPGIGKSRLLRECARLKSSATALSVQCGPDAHA